MNVHSYHQAPCKNILGTNNPRHCQIERKTNSDEAGQCISHVKYICSLCIEPTYSIFHSLPHRGQGEDNSGLGTRTSSSLFCHIRNTLLIFVSSFDLNNKLKESSYGVTGNSVAWK